MPVRFLLVALGLAAGLLLGEGASRVREHLQCVQRTAGFATFRAFYGWGHRAGAHGWGQGCTRDGVEWRTYTRIDARGLRDDIPYDRTADFRILVLGDSFTEGMQVDQADTYPKLLERRLAATVPGVEVVNAGTSAWGTDNELLYFRHEGWRYHPDLVLLAFDTTNDVLENMRALEARNPLYPDKPYFVLDRGRLVLRHHPLPPLSRTRRALAAMTGPLMLHSALFRFAASVPMVQRQIQLPPPRPHPPGGIVDSMDVYRTAYPPVWQDAWRITRGLILMLERDVEAHGARLAVVVVNAREEVSRQRWQTALRARPTLRDAALDVEKPNRLITRFLARRGIPTIATLDDFRRHFGETGMPGFFRWDIHWAPAGHELAAQVIERELRTLHLVHDAPSPGRRQAATAQ